MRFALGEADRERFGTPEWLEFDLRDVSVTDMEELAARFGFDPHDWPEPYRGTIALEDAGDGAEPKPPPWRNHALCWMLLRQNGFMVTWEEAGEVRVHRLRSHPDDIAALQAETDALGKENPDLRTTTSPDSEPSTTPPSSTSTD